MRGRKSIVDWQNVRVIKGGGGYWDWLRKAKYRWVDDGYIEPNRANPDMLTEGQTINKEQIDEETFHDLTEIFEDILTEQQYIIFELIFKYNMTFRRVAKKMKLSVSTVHEHYQKSVDKIKQYYERNYHV